MKDIAWGGFIGLGALVLFMVVLWLLFSSSEAKERECRSEAAKSNTTCIVVVRQI
jgi:hypothetical protein